MIAMQIGRYIVTMASTGVILLIGFQLSELTWSEVVGIIYGVAQGLAQIHCDIKPHNILLTKAEEINAWAEAATGGLIEDLLQPGSPKPQSAIVLANGLYFKGTWARGYKFNAEYTEKRDFYLLNGDTNFDERGGLQNLLKKLVSNPGIEFKLSNETLDKFWIPILKFSYKFDVSKTMEDMGMPLSSVQNPMDFLRMFHIPEYVLLFEQTIIQKAYIEIDEKGTEAAAVNFFDIALGCSMEKLLNMPSFVADHPFLFMIKEAKSGLDFFIGAVLDLTQSD